MDVDVHVGLRQADREQHHREPVARQEGPVGVQGRLKKRRVAHRTTVHDQNDLVAIAAREIRRADQPAHADAVLGAVDGEQPLGDVVAPYGADARAQVGRGRCREHSPPVVGHTQVGPWVR
jgi:hypothetical protein